MPEQQINSEYLTIRVTPELKEAVTKLAEKERRKNSFMAYILIEEALAARAKKRKASVTN